MHTISISYTLVWQLINFPHIQISRCRKVFNVKTGRLIKPTINGGSVGYWVAPKVFIPKSKINTSVEKIKKEYLPF